MSSINPHFTFRYSQPAEYHFSHDSIFLARRVFEILRAEDKTPRSVLDLCAGCGVIGIDFAFHRQSAGLKLPQRIDFLEIQEAYQSHFSTNILNAPQLKEFAFLNLNYDQVFQKPELRERYDLILCNPPYFKKELGVLSPSEFKNRCRFFLDSDFKTLLRSIAYLLAPEGEAFVLVKDLLENGHSFKNEMRTDLEFAKLEKIRDTDLFRFSRVADQR